MEFAKKRMGVFLETIDNIIFLLKQKGAKKNTNLKSVKKCKKISLRAKK